MIGTHGGNQGMGWRLYENTSQKIWLRKYILLLII